MSTASRLPGIVTTDHVFRLPLDHTAPQGEQIEVYAREVVAARREKDDLPWLLFLQGGPGGKAGRPLGRDGWLERALDDYRVLLLDQRGTGRSTPATRQTLARRGGAPEQADYLAYFRADSIVRDAELIRRRLLGDDRRWSVLGQSFGGFCLLTYLSIAPGGCTRPSSPVASRVCAARPTMSTGRPTPGSSARTRSTTPGSRRTSRSSGGSPLTWRPRPRPCPTADCSPSRRSRPSA